MSVKFEETKKTFSAILRNVTVSIRAPQVRGKKRSGCYALVDLPDDEDQRNEVLDALEGAPCDIIVQNNRILFSVSKFIKVAFGNSEDLYTIDDMTVIACTGQANIKVRWCEYKWEDQKGEEQETKQLQLVGVRFAHKCEAEAPEDELSGLTWEAME